MEDYNEHHEENIEFHEEEMDTHEIAATAYNRVDALIELLIRKGMISEDEYDRIEEELYSENFDEEDEEEDEEPEGPGFQPSF